MKLLFLKLLISLFLIKKKKKKKKKIIKKIKIIFIKLFI